MRYRIGIDTDALHKDAIDSFWKEVAYPKASGRKGWDQTLLIKRLYYPVITFVVSPSCCGKHITKRVPLPGWLMAPMHPPW